MTNTTDTPRALTQEAQRLARMAGHARLRGEGNAAGFSAVTALRRAVEEAHAFDVDTLPLRVLAAASLDKIREQSERATTIGLRGLATDTETAELLALSKEVETAEAESSLFAIVARVRAWPADRKVMPVKVAQKLSIKVRRATGYVCAHGVSRQAIYRAFGVARKHGISLAPVAS